LNGESRPKLFSIHNESPDASVFIEGVAFVP
jgi:hypothetical protein